MDQIQFKTLNEFITAFKEFNEALRNLKVTLDGIEIKLNEMNNDGDTGYDEERIGKGDESKIDQ